MANTTTLTLKAGDTWPPIRCVASDEDGLLDVAEADKITLYLKNGATLITGEMEVIDPPDAEGMNLQYTWAEGDTNIAGTYQGEVKILWDEGTTPDEIERVPNSGTVSVVIEPNQA